MKNRQTLLLRAAVFVAFAAVMHPASATDWYVDDANGDDAYAGTSAALAKKTIQAAIDLVGNGDNVYVAPGRYNTGSMVCAFNNATARVVITNKINLVATGRKEETFIDGGEEMRCIYVYSSSSSPKYTKADGTVIRGFTICNGKLTGSNSTGAGAVISQSYLVDCIVSNNVTAYRGGGSWQGTAIRCFYTDNYASDHGSVAGSTVFLNSVMAFQRGNGRPFYYGGPMVNCTIFGNIAGTYTFSSSSKYYLYNTIYAGNSSQAFYVTAQTIASNCVFSAGTTAWSEDYCGNIKTEVPDYCFAAPAFNDWRPTVEFNIGEHGDAELLKKVSLPAGLEGERYIDYNGKPIPTTGSITCGAVQEVYTPSGTPMKVDGGMEVEGRGRVVSSSTAATIKKCLYFWTEGSVSMHKIRKAGTGIGDVVWYTVSTNGVYRTDLLPDTNNWVVVLAYGGITNEIAVVKPNKTYYVDAELGDDSYEGDDLGTAVHPYATIQAAIDVAPTGKDNNSYKSYVIVVRRGEYRTGGTTTGRIDIPNKVNNTWQYRNFRIVSEEGPEKTFIIGARGAGDNGLGEGALRCVRSAIGTFIQGFTLTGGYSSEGAAFWSNAVGNSMLVDCIASNNCSSGSIIYRVQVQRCRVEGNTITSTNAGDVRESNVTMCEIVQSSESVASSCAVVGSPTYVHFSAVKGRSHASAHFSASILGGGQSIGTGSGYAKYCFAHGDPLTGSTGTAVQNCLNGKSRCLDFLKGDFRLRSDSPAIGMVTFDPSAYYTALTLDMDGNLPPLDTLEGWTAGPRQQASVEWIPMGLMLIVE